MSDTETMADGLRRLRGRYGSYGPDYSRNIMAAVADAELFLARGQEDAAHRYFDLARCRAGEISFELFQAAHG